MRRPQGRRAAWLLPPMLALLLVQTATAQVPPVATVSVVSPTQEVLPGQEAALEVTVTLRCDRVLAPSAADVHLNVSAPFLVVSGATTMVFPADACQGGATSAQRSTTFRVSPTGEAPGLQAIAGRVTASPPDGATPSGEPDPNADFAVQVGYLPLSQVQVPVKLKACPGDCAFDLVVTNLGNARTQYIFSWGTDPSDGWSGTLPGPLVLDAPNLGTGANEGVVQVHVRGGSDEQAFTIIVTPTAADDAARTGAPLTVNVLARDVGLLQEAPGLGPAPVLGILAAALLAARRRA